MYELVVEQHFEAAHFLRGYKGKCENLHGHRYSVVVRLKTAKLNEIGLAYDFTEIKRHLKDIMGRLDHVCLNDIPPFDKINPSAENIATTIYNELRAQIADRSIKIAAVEAWENPFQGAVYRPDD
jgi:6-pyruvoyltetrahydropterin/6-carboxytetrahydropterin synthase